MYVLYIYIERKYIYIYKAKIIIKQRDTDTNGGALRFRKLNGNEPSEILVNL